MENNKEDYLLAEDIGSWHVLEWTDHISKQKNPGFKAKLKLTDKNNKSSNCYVYLCHPFYIAAFCESCETKNLSEMNKIKKLTAADCVGQRGKCTIKTNHGTNGFCQSIVNRYLPYSGIYTDQAQEEIKFDEDEEAVTKSDSIKEAEPWVDDDIPF